MAFIVCPSAANICSSALFAISMLIVFIAFVIQWGRGILQNPRPCSLGVFFTIERDPRRLCYTLSHIIVTPIAGEAHPVC